MGVGKAPESPQPSKRKASVPRAVRCGDCKKIGFVQFSEGFNFKKADRIMNEKPICGNCGYCGKIGVELIPVPKLTASDRKEFAHLVNIQETLEYAAERGWEVGPRNAIMPVARLKMYEEWRKEGKGPVGEAHFEEIRNGP